MGGITPALADPGKRREALRLLVQLPPLARSYEFHHSAEHLVGEGVDRYGGSAERKGERHRMGVSRVESRRSSFRVRGAEGSFGRRLERVGEKEGGKGGKEREKRVLNRVRDSR